MSAVLRFMLESSFLRASSPGREADTLASRSSRRATSAAVASVRRAAASCAVQGEGSG
jgi:hypothetical protein